ncbi:MAG: hypothetical protein SOH95_00060 [Bifidobacterium crudilactis]|jgi:hypothetical protein
MASRFRIDRHPDYPEVFALTYQHADTSMAVRFGLEDLKALSAQCSDALASYERLKASGFPGYFVPQ